jgi:pyrimidine operon attenuation protein / uracil phosphoribosyltransferase
MQAPDADAALANLLQQTTAAWRDAPPLIVGIHTGGAWIAERIRLAFGDHLPPISTLDIGFYRDDLHLSGLKGVAASSLNESIDGREVLLIDDILYSGRTIRAALGALFDYGRPARVRLGCLVVREGRELPIQADYFGVEWATKGPGRLKLRGPDPLALEWRE